jgi:hypothetical protein
MPSDSDYTSSGERRKKKHKMRDRKKHPYRKHGSQRSMNFSKKD